MRVFIKINLLSHANEFSYFIIYFFEVHVADNPFLLSLFILF